MAKRRPRPHRAPVTADPKATKDEPLGMDERVSFHPMKPEDVLRKLLQTPPLQRDREDKPDSDVT